MIPKRDEYLAFLKTAVEKLTVSSPMTTIHLVNVAAVSECRRLLVKHDFRPS